MYPSRRCAMFGLRASPTPLLLAGDRRGQAFMSRFLRLLSVYKYEPIQADREIRVLALQPSRRLEDPIVCRIHPLRTDEPQAAFDYEALSYCWGSSSKQFSIQVCDALHDPTMYRLSVTQNLHAALKRVRLPEKERLVWADALCINQDDAEEKVAQIGMMGQIYSNATGVIVFLGDTHETEQQDIDESIETILLLNQLILQRWEEAHAADKDFDPYPVNLGTMEIFTWTVSPEESLRRWWAMLRLFQRPWFFRVWILQELILAKKATVVWGGHEIPWDKVMAAAELISLTSHRLLLPFEPKYTGVDTALIMGSWNHPVPAEQERSFQTDLVPLATMPVFRNFHAKFDNDKYNAILALLKVPSALGVSDTSRETSAELFHKLATSYIYVGGSVFAILAMVDGVPASSRAPIPSWVPDWSQTGVPRSWSSYSHDGKCIFNACGMSKPIIQFDDTLTVLHAAGKSFGVIAEVSRVYDPPVRDFDAFTDGVHLARETRTRTKACFSEYRDIFSRNRRDGLKADDKIAEEYFWRLLICNRGAGAESARDEEGEFFHHFEAFYADPAIYLNTDHSMEMLQRSEDAGRFEALIKSWSMTNRVFFATQDGQFGWAPRYAQPGDVVTILSGAPVPFLLSPTDVPGQYRVLGECYVHDLMDGEAFDRDTRPMYDVVIV